MEFLQAYILGVVEGITEFLPISSTGHLILVGKWLHFEGRLEVFFDVFIQLGAILAVVVLYFRRFLGLLTIDPNRPLWEGFRGPAGVLKLAVACMPAAFVGLLAHDAIEAYLFRPIPVAAALIAGALLMIAVERSRRRVRIQDISQVTITQALFVGCMQCLSLWPGMSRSACTIVGGLLCGMERRCAAEFSFLVAVPIMVMAVGFSTYKHAMEFSRDDIVLLGTGFGIAFVTAVLAIRIFIDLLGRTTLVPFALYRIVLGLAVLAVSLG